MHIVGELHAVAKMLTEPGEHGGDCLKIRLIVEDALLRPRVRGPGCDYRIAEAAAPILPELTTNDGPSLIDIALDVRKEFVHGIATRVRIAGHGSTARPTEKLVERHARHLALD